MFNYKLFREQKVPTQKEIVSNWGQEKFQNPMVSIICNTFNHECFIEDALISFLIQKTDFTFEIIVHDDASTDRTGEIIKFYAELYPLIIKPIYQSENQFSKSVSLPFQNALKKAKGKFIALCEGDDFFLDNDKLSLQVAHMEKDQRVQLTFHNAIVINSEGRMIEKTNKNLDGAKIFNTEDVIQHWFIHTQTIIFRNNISASEFDFFKGVINIDWLIQLICSTKGTLVFVPGINSIYRKHENSFSSTYLKNSKVRALKLVLLMDTFNYYSSFRFNRLIQLKKESILMEFFEIQLRIKFGSLLYFIFTPRKLLIKLYNKLKSCVYRLKD